MTVRAADLKVRVVPIDDVKLDPDNARLHPQRNLDAIRASLEAFGQRRPLIVGPDMTVVAGNGTLEAARSLGWQRIAVNVWDDLENARAYAIVDNRTAELAEWNGPVLLTSLDALEADGWTPDRLGFTAKERRSLAARMEVDVVEDEIPPTPTRTRTKPGTLWQLGPHRLLCGDSRNPADVVRLLDGEPVDFLFTSPPYHVEKPYPDGDGGPWADYEALLVDVLAAWTPHLPAGRALCWNIGTAPDTRPGRHYALLEAAGLAYVRQYSWHKVGVPVPLFHHTRSEARARVLTSNYAHELVLMFAQQSLEPGGPVVRDLDPEYAHDLVLMFANGSLEPGEAVQFGSALECDTFSLGQSAAGREAEAAPSSRGDGTRLETRKRKAHPAPFPVALPAAFTVHLADVGAIVADPFMGSGTTIIAAEQTGRRGYGIELDPGYCDVAVRRWEKLTGVKAKRVP